MQAWCVLCFQSLAGARGLSHELPQESVYYSTSRGDPISTESLSTEVRNLNHCCVHYTPLYPTSNIDCRHGELAPVYSSVSDARNLAQAGDDNWIAKLEPGDYWKDP